MNHDIKSLPANFSGQLDVLTAPGLRVEIRRNDRNYALRDYVQIREFIPLGERFTGRAMDFRIVGIVPATPANGLKNGFCLLALAPVEVPIQTATPAPFLPITEAPELTLFARVVDVSPVLQTITDERGERHQLTGEAMDPMARRGDTGTLLIYSGNRLKFLAVECAHRFDPITCKCDACGFPQHLQ